MKIQQQWKGTFRKAAAFLQEGRFTYSCTAIYFAFYGMTNDPSKATPPPQELFFRIFHPRNLGYSRAWWEKYDVESRILALLLAAEICKHEEEWA